MYPYCLNRIGGSCPDRSLSHSTFLLQSSGEWPGISVMKHGAHSIGKYPNHLFSYTIRCRVVWDRGCAIDAVALANVAYLAH